ncbi:MAG: hypothetical protein M3Q07_19705 [Pseudobdellovibrionaceae bacterium]|nr:hypothetical protein [Pseudobdellovibrionaceae bacterium]
MVIIISILLALVSPSSAWCNEPPDPQRWAQEISDEVWLDTPGMIRNFTIVAGGNSRQKMWTQIGSQISQLGFLKFFDPGHLVFAQLLQREGAPKPTLEQALSVAPVQLVLNDDGRRMEASTPGANGLEPIGRWPIPNNARKAVEPFFQWLTANLGYDAIVLDHKEEIILAALLNRKVELGQGLLLKNSAALWSLKPKQQKGDALLQMLIFDGEYAVFEVLLSKKEIVKIHPGTKILLGQSKRFEKVLQEKR